MYAKGSHILQRACAQCRTAFLCCDVQESTEHEIPNGADMVLVSNTMARIHEALGDDKSIFIATEMFVEEHGRLHKDIKLPEDAHVFCKESLSMLTPDVLPYIIGDKTKGIEPVQQVVLWGHQTCMSVLHTADDLLQRDMRVAVAIDGCGTELEIDHRIAALNMSRWDGLTLTSATSVLLQLVDPTKTKEVVKIMKNHLTDSTRTTWGAP